jgi:hypothetical protein
MWMKIEAVGAQMGRWETEYVLRGERRRLGLYAAWRHRPKPPETNGHPTTPLCAKQPCLACGSINQWLPRPVAACRRPTYLLLT